MSFLRNKSHEDVVAYLRQGIDPELDSEGIVYQIASSFMVYHFALEAAVKEAHTIQTDGKAKNIHIPYFICV